MENFKSIELFAGAGGLALGLHESGFNPQLLVEIDKYASETLRLNKPDWNVLNTDIRAIDLNSLNISQDIDLISGGAPCQSFSYAGLRGGLEDTRGTLFYDFARFIDFFKPKVFLFENVKGLITHEGGHTINTIISTFENLGYVVRWELLKAIHYEVAQKRERIIMIGVRKDIHDINGDFIYPKPQNKILTLRDALVDVPESIGASYPETKKKVLDLVPPGGYWRDLPVEVAKDYMGVSYYSGGGRTGMARRISWDEPSLTLTTSPAQKQTERCHPDETRPFTTREYARIQSFPDSWEFYGSLGNVYKQIGNAVPVNLAKHVGNSINKYLSKGIK
ncbi:DNA cytosine methyltransferase [Listeria newyorkensis]|uniref:DNA cytosine methyltransferase n=1 Tax=Listeria newyorkensis TaxID=1497681 RepID=UPI0021AB6CAF|nr:DNA cytosine methyltransferase [Listeria newyorkensis]